MITCAVSYHVPPPRWSIELGRIVAYNCLTIGSKGCTRPAISPSINLGETLSNEHGSKITLIKMVSKKEMDDLDIRQGTN